MCICCLKRGKYKEAFDTIRHLNTEFTFQTSDVYKPEQAVFLMAICARLLGLWKEAEKQYSSLKAGCRKFKNQIIKNLTCSLLLLPLEKSRIQFEKALE